jgi:hypothetical protein
MKKLIVLIWIAMGMATYAAGQQADQLIFREKIYDFGNIEEAKGLADHEFIFTNNAGRPVKILSVHASCGCTTPGWSQSPVPPGKTGFIKASFDPKGRPGYFNKSLTITTDLDANPIILEIKGQVVDKVNTVAGDFPVPNGNLYFKTKAINMGTIFINKFPAQKQFEVMNKGAMPVRFVEVLNPPYLKVEMPAVIQPNGTGVIKVTYDARQRNRFGFTSDNIQITTDDPGNEVKQFSVFATLEEFYTTPVGEEATKAPVLVIRQPNIDLGRTHQSAAIEKNVVLKNTGRSNLQLKAFQGNCSCIGATPEKDVIAPGDSINVKVSFTPQAREGTQQKAITLYSNDPRNPVQRIMVQVYVEE